MPKKDLTDMSHIDFPKYFTVGTDDGKKKVHSKQCAGVSTAYNKDNDVKLDSVTEKEALERARACGHCSK